MGRSSDDDFLWVVGVRGRERVRERVRVRLREVGTTLEKGVSSISDCVGMTDSLFFGCFCCLLFCSFFFSVRPLLVPSCCFFRVSTAFFFGSAFFLSLVFFS